MRFAICNEIFQGWPLEAALGYAAGLGYDGIEIAPFTLASSVAAIDDRQRRHIRDTASRVGIAISGIHWVLVQAEGMHLTHPDPVVRQNTAEYFCQLVDFCADLGGEVMVVGSPKQRSLMPGVTYEQAWEWALATFRPALDVAARRSVIICFEPLAPSETNFVNTAAEAIRFAQQFASPHFKIILDVKAMSSEPDPVPQIIRQSAPHFAYFHANDKNLKGPGFGTTDFVPIAEALRAVGYHQWVSVEVFNFEEGPRVIAQKSLENLKQAFRQPK
jgi:sugar phosphate isomerase/epimerase